MPPRVAEVPVEVIGPAPIRERFERPVLKPVLERPVIERPVPVLEQKILTAPVIE